MAMMRTRFIGSLMINTVKVSRPVACRALTIHSSFKFCYVHPAGAKISPRQAFLQADNRCYSFTSKDKTGYFGQDVTIADVMDGVLHKYLVLIDCREPHELKETGKIADAINIPVDEIEKAFSLSDDEFKKKYHIYKPNVMSERVVIYCRTGRRALTACEKLHKLGYEKVKRYPGGMTEWTKMLFGKTEDDGGDKKKAD